MIKLLKLVSGEDVIAEVETLENEYRLKNPMKIIISPMGIGMMGLLDCAQQKTVNIKYEHVMFDVTPEQELYNAYNEKFGSGIVIPKSGISLNTGD
jgi:hypothetical protein